MFVLLVAGSAARLVRVSLGASAAAVPARRNRRLDRRPLRLRVLPDPLRSHHAQSATTGQVPFTFENQDAPLRKNIEFVLFGLSLIFR